MVDSVYKLINDEFVTKRYSSLSILTKLTKDNYKIQSDTVKDDFRNILLSKYYANDIKIKTCIILDKNWDKKEYIELEYENVIYKIVVDYYT